MNEIIKAQAQAVQGQQAQTFNAALFSSFVSWVDRSEATTRAYTKNLRQFAAWLRYTGTSNPDRQSIISYRQFLTEEHPAICLDNAAPDGWRYRTDSTGESARVICKPNTVQLYLRSVSQFFKWTAAAGLYPNIADNIHAPKVDHSTHKKDALTPAQVLAVEKSITAHAAANESEAANKEKDRAGRIERTTEQSKRLYAMYLLTVTAGLRTIEIHRANVKDLEEIDGQAVLYIWGKGHTEADQRKPIAHEVYEAIQDYLKSRTDHPTGSSPLFVSTGNRAGGKRIATTTISTMLKKALKDAGFNSERLTAHSLRHTAGTAAQSITGNIFETQKYMRHCDPATTEIYVHEGQQERDKEAGLAQDVYNLYHGKATGAAADLGQVLANLTPAQVEKLAALAADLK